MTFFSRAAAAVAMTISFFGLSAQSTAGLAAGVEQMLPEPAVAVAAPTTFDNNELAAGDIVAYPTLAAAVAAQSTHDGDDEAIQCLAGAIYYESKGEPLSGQLAVADVIINRSKSGRFPSDICDGEADRALYFNRGRAPASGLTRVATIGNHIFWR